MVNFLHKKIFVAVLKICLELKVSWGKAAEIGPYLAYLHDAVCSPCHPFMLTISVQFHVKVQVIKCF